MTLVEWVCSVATKAHYTGRGGQAAANMRLGKTEPHMVRCSNDPGDSELSSTIVRVRCSLL